MIKKQLILLLVVVIVVVAAAFIVIFQGPPGGQLSLPRESDGCYYQTVTGDFIVNNIEEIPVDSCSFDGENYDPFTLGVITNGFSHDDICLSADNLEEWSCNNNATSTGTITIFLGENEITCEDCSIALQSGNETVYRTDETGYWNLSGIDSWVQLGDPFSITEDTVVEAYIRMRWKSEDVTDLKIIPSSESCTGTQEYYSGNDSNTEWIISPWDLIDTVVSGTYEYKFCGRHAGGWTSYVDWAEVKVISGEVDSGCSGSDTRSCGTDIGECTAGIETCQDGEWGDCIGSVGPGDEVCGSSDPENVFDWKDEDCDGLRDSEDQEAHDYCATLYGDDTYGCVEGTTDLFTCEIAYSPCDDPIALGGDGDGFGTDAGNSNLDCEDTRVDCDNTDAKINPDASEICDDGIDNNCDGNVDEDCGSSGGPGDDVSSCGDGNCDSDETAESCPADCGTPPSSCGDGICDGGSTITLDVGESETVSVYGSDIIVTLSSVSSDTQAIILINGDSYTVEEGVVYEPSGVPVYIEGITYAQQVYKVKTTGECTLGCSDGACVASTSVWTCPEQTDASTPETQTR